jgi:hypothetical protein
MINRRELILLSGGGSLAPSPDFSRRIGASGSRI